MNAELRQAAEQWLGKKGNSLVKLARKSGVGYSTIRRVFQNEQEPTIKTQLLIGVVVLTPDKCMSIFKDQMPEFFTVGSGKIEEAEGVREEFLSSPMAHGIISLAMRGTTKEEIKEEYGRSGIEILEDFLSSSILNEINEKIYADNISINSLDEICKAVQLSSAQFTPHNFVSGCWWSEGWNTPGIVELARCCTEFNAKIEELKKNTRLRGDLSATVGMFMFRRGNKWL